jgi:GT2 family glycosyltransferase
MKKIAVLLTVHNRKSKTLNCLKNLFLNNSHDNASIDVFLTDDGSTDGTKEAISQFYPQVKVLLGDGNLYWNGGMLLAWRKALSEEGYDYFLWLNDDTILKNNSINDLLEVSKMQEDAIIVGSTSEFEKGDRISYGGRKYKRNFPLIKPDNEKAIPCDTFNGNIVLIPNSVQEQIGILDPYFRHSFGDIEYGLRAKESGVSSFIAPGVLGSCERDKSVPIFRKKGVPLIKRYKLLYSPLGFNPKEDFYLNKKYFSLMKSIWWFIKVHINVLFTK